MSFTLPDNIRRQLLVFDISNQTIITNLNKVLRNLCEEYSNGPKWILDNLRFAKMEDDCIGIEWSGRNIYCFIYPHIITIDKTILLASGKVHHNEREFNICSMNLFNMYFRNVCLSH